MYHNVLTHKYYIMVDVEHACMVQLLWHKLFMTYSFVVALFYHAIIIN